MAAVPDQRPVGVTQWPVTAASSSSPDLPIVCGSCDTAGPTQRGLPCPSLRSGAQSQTIKNAITRRHRGDRTWWITHWEGVSAAAFCTTYRVRASAAMAQPGTHRGRRSEQSARYGSREFRLSLWPRERREAAPPTSSAHATQVGAMASGWHQRARFGVGHSP